MHWLLFIASNVAQAEEHPSLNGFLRIPPGLSLEMSYVAEPMIEPSSGEWGYAHGLEFMTQLSLGFVHEDVSTWKEYDHWILTFDVQQYADTGDFGEKIGVSNPAQEIFNPAGVYLGELSLTRNPGAGKLYIKLGSISADADFLSPEISGMYTHAAFNNQYNVSIGNFPISPMNALGGVVGYELTDRVHFKTGVYQLSSTRTDSDLRGWDFTTTLDDGLLEFVQLNGIIGESPESLDICPPDDHTFSRHSYNCDGVEHVINELPSGSWQVGAFFSQDEKIQDERTSNHGLYGNITIPLELGVGAGHRLWASGVYGLHPERNPLPIWVGGGMISQGLFEKRPLDLLLLGFSWSQFSTTDWEQRELLLEMEYSLALSDTIIFQPNVQWFLDTGTPDNQPLVVGAHFQVGL